MKTIFVNTYCNDSILAALKFYFVGGGMKWKCKEGDFSLYVSSLPINLPLPYYR
jgi:hypothetical protein